MRHKCSECGAYGVSVEDSVELTCDHDSHVVEYYCPGCNNFQQVTDSNECVECGTDLSRFHPMPEVEELPPEMVIVGEGSTTYHKATEVDGEYEVDCWSSLEDYEVIPESEIEDETRCGRCYS